MTAAGTDAERATRRWRVVAAGRVVVVLVATALVATTPATSWAAAASPGVTAAATGVPHVATTFKVPGGAYVAAVDTVRNRLWVGNTDDDRVSAVDGQTHQVTAVATGACCGLYGIDVDPLRDHVYVSGIDDGVYVLDGHHPGRAPVLIHTGLLFESGFQLFDNPLSQRLYVESLYDGTVAVVDTATLQVVKHLVFAGAPCGVAIDPATNLVYFSLPGHVTVIDGTTNHVARRIPVPGPSGCGPVAVDFVTNRVYVADSALTVIDGATGTVLRSVTLPVAAPALGLVVDSLAHRVYVGASNNTVYEVNGATNRVTGHVGLGGFISDMDVNPFTHTVYAVVQTGPGHSHVAVVKG